jgi:hypothetical protein
MAIVATDLLLRLSGGSGNTDPDLALGGVMSTSTVISTTVSEENLFNNVSASDASSGKTYYRGLYFLNNHGSISLTGSACWISTQTPSSTTALAIALAGEGVNATMETIANENTAPVGESFTAPATFGAGLSTGTIAAGQRYGVWIRYLVDASSPAYDNDDSAISLQGSTTA